MAAKSFPETLVDCTQDRSVRVETAVGLFVYNIFTVAISALHTAAELFGLVLRIAGQPAFYLQCDEPISLSSTLTPLYCKHACLSWILCAQRARHVLLRCRGNCNPRR